MPDPITMTILAAKGMAALVKSKAVVSAAQCLVVYAKGHGVATALTAGATLCCATGAIVVTCDMLEGIGKFEEGYSEGNKRKMINGAAKFAVSASTINGITVPEGHEALCDAVEQSGASIPLKRGMRAALEELAGHIVDRATQDRCSTREDMI